MLSLFSPALAGAKLNLPALAKFEKSSPHAVPDDTRVARRPLGPFLYALTEKLTPRRNRRSSSHRVDEGGRGRRGRSSKPRAKKLEAALKSARIRKAVAVYHIVTAGASGRSPVRAVPVDAEAGAGAAAELLPEVSPDSAGDHARRVARRRAEGKRRQTGQGARGLPREASR